MQKPRIWKIVPVLEGADRPPSAVSLAVSVATGKREVLLVQKTQPVKNKKTWYDIEFNLFRSRKEKIGIENSKRKYNKKKPEGDCKQLFFCFIRMLKTNRLEIAHLGAVGVDEVLHAVFVGERVGKELEAVPFRNVYNELFHLRKLLLLEIHHGDTLAVNIYTEYIIYIYMYISYEC